MGEDAKFKVNAIRETNAARDAIAAGEMSHAEALTHLTESASSVEHTSPGYRQYRSIGDSAIRQEAIALGKPLPREDETRRTD